ncbi:hypothetical protein [Desulfopila inferna]|uniref:hypothetical protein n=1 Tax=Desulfopila inferna TaxID=468528 RepID=UPI001965034B|nr:hypothetical protein [Desulfopila inferna]MBM9603006.1 hypothetical protein [Desulfopila inferna]
METIQESVEQSLQYSIEQYTAILRHSDNLVRMLDTCEYSGIGHYAEELEEMQSAARKNDEVWLSHFRDDPQQWQDNALLVERMQLVHTLLERNEALMPRLQAVVAVARSEQARLNEGRTVIAGYTPSVKHTRQITRTA